MSFDKVKYRCKKWKLKPQEVVYLVPDNPTVKVFLFNEYGYYPVYAYATVLAKAEDKYFCTYTYKSKVYNKWFYTEEIQYESYDTIMLLEHPGFGYE